MEEGACSQARPRAGRHLSEASSHLILGTPLASAWGCWEGQESKEMVQYVQRPLGGARGAAEQKEPGKSVGPVGGSRSQGALQAGGGGVGKKQGTL
jgi:hypothetical protein